MKSVPAKTESSVKLSKAFEIAHSDFKQTPFQYGACKTDHKDGREIRPEYRAIDFFNDKCCAARVKDMLWRLGLPLPAEDKIFRGTHHDMLFVDSHGVVVRIGPLDVEDLMNPAILQPLGWLQDKDMPVKLGVDEKETLPLTAAVYPGIELYSDWLKGESDEASCGNFSLIYLTQNISDIAVEENQGIIRVDGGDGEDIAVDILLDVDNANNKSLSATACARREAMANASEEMQSPADIMALGVSSVLNLLDTKGRGGFIPFLRAFAAHQPLRHLFWEAFQNPNNPDILKRARFWEVCAAIVNNPQAMTMPVWSEKKDASGKKIFVRNEVCVPKVVLYRPWTGADEDRIATDASLRAAIRRENIRNSRPYDDAEVHGM